MAIRLRFSNPCFACAATLWLLCVGAFAKESVNKSDALIDSKHDPAGIEFFEKRIRPLLVEHCYDCHGPEEQESELRLDRYSDLLQGGLGGPAVVPGKPQASLLVTAVGYLDNDLQMPPEEKLTKAQIADLTRWVEMGAPHPNAGQMEPRTSKATSLPPATEHWAYQVPVKPAIPEVHDQQWPNNAIDQFVLARLEQADLLPAPEADRRVLLRRATYDLTGLPPTKEEIDAFLSDQSTAAFEKVIDRLLASPHYGERWGRHWLDIARYADSNGLDENVAQANAWRYRDYVVEAFNTDKPFDQFIREQLAGDLLASNEPDDRNQQKIATGFLSLGPKVLAEVDETKMEMDIVDEQIDTLGKALLGMTLGCARCHDHKFDPFTMQDYYALAGIFKSTHTMDSFTKIARWHEHPLEDKSHQEALAEHENQVAAKQVAIDELIASSTAALQQQLGEGAALPKKPEESFPAETREQLKTQREALAALKKQAPIGPSAMGVKEGNPVEVPIHIRGSHLTLGDTVPRSIPAVFVNLETPRIESHQSGRLELANWLTSKQNPLTARVIVNRVWRWHFGRGLVGTPDNFGRTGEAPTHEKLLDWLAVQFVEDGWSLKALHKQIMLSATYRMSSRHQAKAAEQDPQNQWYWRADLRRLEAEEIRDAMLAVSGQLDTTMGGSALATKNREFIFNHTSKDETSYETNRRSIYLPVIRNHLFDSFTLFDYTDASMPNGNRNTSTVASQALYMMNSEFLDRAAEGLAKRMQQAELPNDTQRITWLYETTVGRVAKEQEIERCLAMLQEFLPTEGENPEEESQQQAWKALCQTLLMSNEFVYLQ